MKVLPQSICLLLIPQSHMTHRKKACDYMEEKPFEALLINA